MGPFNKLFGKSKKQTNGVTEIKKKNQQRMKRWSYNDAIRSNMSIDSDNENPQRSQSRRSRWSIAVVEKLCTSFKNGKQDGGDEIQRNCRKLFSEPLQSTKRIDRRKKRVSAPSKLVVFDAVYDGSEETTVDSTRRSEYADFIFDGDDEDKESDKRDSIYWQGCQNLS